jgi:heme O synthase-like polyprenyltransferase
MGAFYLRLAMRFCMTRERVDARRTFIASVIHLPLLLVVLVACAGWSRFI